MLDGQKMAMNVFMFLQNSAYRLQGVGIGKAVDIIQKMGFTGRKVMSDNSFWTIMYPKFLFYLFVP